MSTLYDGTRNARRTSTDLKVIVIPDEEGLVRAIEDDDVLLEYAVGADDDGRGEGEEGDLGMEDGARVDRDISPQCSVLRYERCGIDRERVWTVATHQ